MDYPIIISNLNDFIFCPASIYFHKLYGRSSTISYQTASQINGTSAHKTVDDGTYSTKKSMITSLEVYSEKYRLSGKIDLYDVDNKILIERKRQINKIYDGYVFQLYAQYFCMLEMGYFIDKLKLYSMIDNKSYMIKLPHEDEIMFQKFEDVINDMNTFKLEEFNQTNREKCKHCIYEPACDRGLL